MLGFASSLALPLVFVATALAVRPVTMSTLSQGTAALTANPAPRMAPCTGCAAVKDQDMQWLDVPCDCTGGGPDMFGYLEISNESLNHGSCTGWFECTGPAGCSWSYDLELIVYNDRPEECYPGGVWAEKTGWPARLNVLNYDFGTLTSSATGCDETGARTGNQVFVGIYETASSSTLCAGVIMRVKCTACE